MSWIFTWFYLTCSFVFAIYEMNERERDGEKKKTENIDNNKYDERSLFQCANTTKNMDKRHLFIPVVLSQATLFLALDFIYNLISKVQDNQHIIQSLCWGLAAHQHFDKPFRILIEFSIARACYQFILLDSHLVIEFCKNGLFSMHTHINTNINPKFTL